MRKKSQKAEAKRLSCWREGEGVLVIKRSVGRTCIELGAKLANEGLLTQEREYCSVNLPPLPRIAVPHPPPNMDIPGFFELFLDTEV